MENNKMIKDIINLKFDGEFHQMDVRTFSVVLLEFDSFVYAINKEINIYDNTDNNIIFNVTATSIGSFQIALDLITLIKDNIFTSEGIQNITNIVATAVGLFSIRQFLKRDRKAKKIIKKDNKKLVITNKDGEELLTDELTYNIYEKNPVIDRSLSYIFRMLDLNKDIKGFSILNEKKDCLFTIKKQDFKNMTEAIEFQDDKSRLLDVVEKLDIMRLSFDKKLKWDFVNGSHNKITAKIIDGDFYKRIESGEKFSKGDVLEVEMRIKQEYDESVDTFINKSYEIKKIIKHTPRDKKDLFTERQVFLTEDKISE